MGTDKGSAMTELFNRVTSTMQVGRNGIRLEEWDAIRPFWRMLTADIDVKRADSLLLPMLEEALVLRILTHRSLYELEEMNQASEQPTVVSKSGAVTWLKTQERLRLVMKEILKRYTASLENQLDCLAAIMAPILEQSEGVLEDAVEFEARKKSAQKKRFPSRRRRRVDPST